jgi:hypothetical protein
MRCFGVKCVNIPNLSEDIGGPLFVLPQGPQRTEVTAESRMSVSDDQFGKWGRDVDRQGT